jgi:hypothetical protein
MRKAMREESRPIDGWMDGMGDRRRQAPLPASRKKLLRTPLSPLPLWL